MWVVVEQLTNAWKLKVSTANLRATLKHTCQARGESRNVVRVSSHVQGWVGSSLEMKAKKGQWSSYWRRVGSGRGHEPTYVYRFIMTDKRESYRPIRGDFSCSCLINRDVIELKPRRLVEDARFSDRDFSTPKPLVSRSFPYPRGYWRLRVMWWFSAVCNVPISQVLGNLCNSFYSLVSLYLKIIVRLFHFWADDTSSGFSMPL